MTLCTPAFSHLLSDQRLWSLSARKQLLTPRSWKTTDQCQTSPSCPKSLRKLFSDSFRTIRWPTIYSILISQLTVPVIAPRQPFSRLLDLSAAFDTIDHAILLSRFSYSFGIYDTVLVWFTSYLSDRTQTVSVNGSKFLPALLHYGVPLGSVLGPILFVLHTQPLSKIIQHHSLYHHSFSDDNQLYISTSLPQLQEIIRTSQSSISDVQAWMHNNKLQLNPNKTEVILITSKHDQKSLSLPFSVDLNGTSIHLSSSVRNLGVTLDQNLSFQHHVSRTCQIYHLELGRISPTRHYLSQDALKTLISVLSCPESINGIPYSLAVLSSSFTNFKKFRTTLQGSSVELLSRIIYLPSFTLFTDFLLNKVLNTNCFLPLNL